MPESRFWRRNRHEDCCLFQAQPGRPPKPRFFCMVSVGFGWRFTTVTPSDIHAFHPGCVGVAFVLSVLWKEVFHPPFAVSISRDVSICCDRPPQRSRRKERAEGRTDRTKRLSGDGAVKPACPCRGRGRTDVQAYPGFSGPINPDFLKDGSCSLFSRLDTRE